MRLTQKQGLKRREFELIGNRLKITHKSVSEFKQWNVNIEEIGDEIHIDKYTRKGAVIVAGCLLGFGTLFFVINKYVNDELTLNIFIGLGIIYLFIGLVILISPIKSELNIIGGMRTISFFLESPSQIEVETFANNLIRESKKIMFDKYSRVDSDIPEETMMNQLLWLRNRGIISDDEFERKKDEYKTLKIMK
jgi:hypothetical protein